MDLITIERIKTFHPKYAEQLKAEYLEINNQLPKGVRLRFSHVLRTNKEQDELFAQGRTKKGSIITNAKGGKSVHNYGLAFDIVVLLDKDKNGTFETAVWNGTHFNTVVKYFKNKGYEWGGDWKFKDSPHFQMLGCRWQDLKVKLDKGEIIKSNGYLYPKL